MGAEYPSTQHKNQDDLDKRGLGKVALSILDEEGHEKVVYEKTLAVDLSSDKEWLFKRNAKLEAELEQLSNHDLLLRQTAHLETLSTILLELLKAQVTTSAEIELKIVGLEYDLQRKLYDLERAIGNMRMPRPQFEGGGISMSTEMAIQELSVDVRSIKDMLRDSPD